MPRADNNKPTHNGYRWIAAKEQVTNERIICLGQRLAQAGIAVPLATLVLLYPYMQSQGQDIVSSALALSSTFTALGLVYAVGADFVMDAASQAYAAGGQTMADLWQSCRQFSLFPKPAPELDVWDMDKAEMPTFYNYHQ